MAFKNIVKNNSFQELITFVKDKLQIDESTGLKQSTNPIWDEVPIQFLFTVIQ